MENDEKKKLLFTLHLDIGDEAWNDPLFSLASYLRESLAEAVAKAGYRRSGRLFISIACENIEDACPRCGGSGVMYPDALTVNPTGTLVECRECLGTGVAR